MNEGFVFFLLKEGTGVAQRLHPDPLPLHWKLVLEKSKTLKTSLKYSKLLSCEGP